MDKAPNPNTLPANSHKNKERHERMRDNLRRFGCCIILYSYEELRRWKRPIAEYSKKQQRALAKDEDPLYELYQFFFGQDGLDEVIKSFDIQLSVENVRRVVRPLFAQARACLEGKTPQENAEMAEADWDLLLEAMSRRMEEDTHGVSDPEDSAL